MSFHKNPKRCDLIRSLTSEKNMCIDHTMRCDHTISKKWTFVHTEISFHHYMNHCKINVDSVAHCRHRHPTKDGNPYGWLALDVLPPKRFSNVIKSGGFLSAPGRTFRVLIFTFRSPWNLRKCCETPWVSPVGIGMMWNDVDTLCMPTDLTRCSQDTVLLGLHPLHCSCCEVKTVNLSPFGVWGCPITPAPCPMLILPILILRIINPPHRRRLHLTLSRPCRQPCFSCQSLIKVPVPFWFTLGKVYQLSFLLIVRVRRMTGTMGDNNRLARTRTRSGTYIDIYILVNGPWMNKNPMQPLVSVTWEKSEGPGVPSWLTDLDTFATNIMMDQAD
jgi:hypothetical protein